MRIQQGGGIHEAKQLPEDTGSACAWGLDFSACRAVGNNFCFLEVSSMKYFVITTKMRYDKSKNNYDVVFHSIVSQ